MDSYDPVRRQMPLSKEGISRRKMTLLAMLTLATILAVVLLVDSYLECTRKEGHEFIWIPTVGCEDLDD